MKKHLLALWLLVIALPVFAQQSQIGMAGQNERFNFLNGPMEWSEPLTRDLRSVKMEQKGIAAVPISVRIRVKKRMVLACHYEVEVTNLSADKSIEFAYYNEYRAVGTAGPGNNYKGNKILHKVKLKPGAKAIGKIIWAEVGFKPKAEQDCLNSYWDILFQDIKGK